MRMFDRAVVAMLVAGTALSAPAVAAPILYTFSGNLSGSLDGEEFSLAPVTFSLESDTDLVFQPNPIVRPSLYTTPFETLDFVIDGTAGTFDSLFQAFSITVAGNGLVGFTEFDSSDIFDVEDDSLIGYDLKSAAGPVTNSPLDFLNFDTPFQTSAGELILFDDDGASITFTATLIQAAVPEPASWAMMIAGFGLVGGALRRTGQREAIA